MLRHTLEVPGSLAQTLLETTQGMRSSQRPLKPTSWVEEILHADQDRRLCRKVARCTGGQLLGVDAALDNRVSFHGGLARLTTKPISAVLASTIRYGLLRRSFDPYANFRPHAFLSNGVDCDADQHEVVHPWVLDAGHLPQAKLEQILDLVDCLHFYTRRLDYADIVHPLISQPLIECCLRIPTYVLTSGGTDRALARKAFADALPPEIARRLTKGGTTGYHHNVLLQNLAFVREYLLEGLLVHEGVLDKRLIEAALSEAEIIRGEHRTSVYAALAAEAWLRHSGGAPESSTARTSPIGGQPQVQASSFEGSRQSPSATSSLT